ncbi:PKD-like domain-containing protein [Flavobacterium yafengii]|uniref:PKD-like domain-containing protein n=1 Tax=Flavobacterium yafengii TaxID=3041253 RepID=UPI0024A86191|nr:PKD-like domain-containing protein [Flavobacterium yafengii]MDI5887643.1 hypothetical protein [Flavobacterium yafengii]
MIKQVKKSKFKKTVAIYLAMMILLETLQPMQMFALTSGPTQPEFNAFTPIGTSDMVNLTTGDFNYNIPIMDVGGYPLNLAYNSGVTMDQEASWVGLGWNLNVGEISRQVRGLPDDFRGDKMRYENNIKDNVTVGTNFNVSPAVFGKDLPFNFGLGVQYNNFEGITFKPSIGVSYALSDQVNVGFNLSGSTGEGASVSPSFSVSTGLKIKETGNTLFAGIGASLNSRKGLENVSVSAQLKKDSYVTNDKTQQSHIVKNGISTDISGSISLNNTNNYTPTKRVAYDNISSTFNAALGTEFIGIEGQWRITGYGSVQKINAKYKNRLIGGYGYENSQYKNNLEGVLDFNREKEQIISKNTNALPVTNYTYDTYNIEGQGVSGMFRPFRSQTSYLYNDNVADFGLSATFGAEVGGGNLFHAGVNFAVSPSTSSTGLWSNKNNTLSVFRESNTDRNNPLYEQSTFKLIGELDTDSESGIYTSRMLGNKPLRLQLDGGKFNRRVIPNYMVKSANIPNATYGATAINSKIKREGRLLRNQTIQKITNKEADNKFVFKNENSKLHHTAGMKVLQSDGTTYVFGKTVYNTTKVEATFDVSGKVGNNRKGTVEYNGNTTGNGNANSDQYVNKITTPGYAHSYLVTSVLSSDYQDIDDNGPSDKDLGTYTNFDYTKSGDIGYASNYKWRVPYGANEASYNEGLKTSKKDQKGNYIYGEKEITYLKKIETKTHVAFIDLEQRKDARGVLGENGGNGSGYMYSIKSIRLYSKPELTAAGISMTTAADLNNTISVKPIKTAHFDYNYELCIGTPNNFEGTKGKLTLKKVYFTYRASNMGKYTPYKFNYSETDPLLNPAYDMKGFDIWGNYKKNEGVLTTSEFPFVEQNKAEADKKTSAWVLKSIILPSGGVLSIQTESDDYKYVQNKKAMQMFKVIGAGNSATPPTNLSGELFTSSNHYKYIYVNVGDTTLTNQEFIDKYLSENINKPIYFKFLMKMNSISSDFVGGYFEIDQLKKADMIVANNTVAIPLKFLKIDGLINGDRKVNPIVKSGWGFGRTFLNRAVYSIGGDEINKNFISIVKELVGSISSMTAVFKSPNGLLETKGCARYFDAERSWIRLENPNGKKLGGGLRVKKIQLSDNWDVMNSVEANSIYKDIYNEKYGQDYSYDLEDGSSSGVATFEPNASPENPFVEPFYGKDGNYADRIGAPKEMNYIEKPFGESFFPSPKVTYSKVTVTNLDKHTENENKIVKKHATGKVVTEHYTTYDFPTQVDYTDLDIRPDELKSPLLNILNVISINHLTATQGFSIETNDMDGKMKSEKIYGEGQKAPISRVDYKYNVGADGKLDNNLTTINSKGQTQTNLLGVNYDLINDFNESNSTTKTLGADGNLAAFILAIFPGIVPTVLPRFAYHESILRTGTTTKVVHKTGILIEKVAYDLGSRVSTKNLAWDAKTGQVLLTKTINEFDDNYYSFNYPAYWNYENMGMASENIDVVGKLVPNGSYFDIEGFSSSDISKYFKIGDELILGGGEKFWINGYDSNINKTQVQLISRNGAIISQSNLPSNLNFKIVRSGNRNQQMTSMASVTSMINPIDKNNDKIIENITDATFGYTVGSAMDWKVINASAVEFSDIWNSQCENGLPSEAGLKPDDAGLINTNGITVNPFLYNVKGNWRAVKSHAYLTVRNNFVTVNRRKAGYFINFNPFYKLNESSWAKDTLGWTFASEVTKYSPYGAELENKDALNRYSSAQYGYNYTLPVAVVSNAKYSEIGFDGFEDYGIPNPSLKPHFGFTQGLSADDVSVARDKSHTGRNSLVIKGGKRATFTRKIDGCKVNTLPSICQATATATPVTQTISSGQTTNIALSSTVAGTTFEWTPNVTGVIGASAGSGNSIAQILTNNGTVMKTITYTIIPKLNGCSGQSIQVNINVQPSGGNVIEDVHANGFMEPCIGGSINDYMGVNISMTGNVSVDTNFYVDVYYTNPGPSANCVTPMSTSFTITVLAGTSSGEISACSNGVYFSQGAEICRAVVTGSDNTVDTISFQ